MARTTLPISALVAESSAATSAGLTTPAGTAIDQPNGMVVTAAALVTETIPAKYSAQGIFFRVTNTFAGVKSVIIRAGVNPPAFTKDLGDLTVSLPASTGDVFVGPIDLSRHAQADGSINIDFAAGTTGAITCFAAPRQSPN